MEAAVAVKALGALAQDSRLAVFRLLVQQGPQGLTPGAICEALGIPAPTLSFHLKELNHAGLISAQQNGRSIAYSVDFSAIRGLVEFLYENCCGAGGQSCDPLCPPATAPAQRKRKLLRSKHESLSRTRSRR